MQRKVMLATPAGDFKADVYYINSLVQTISACAKRDIALFPVFWPGEALLQHARNALVQLAIDAKVDDVLMIDADQEWTPGQAISLLNYPVDVVGAPVRKKTDGKEDYNVRALDGRIPIDEKTGLWMVDAVGTGFLRVSGAALKTVWEASAEYDNNGKFRMVFETALKGGKLVSEDTIFCHKLQAHGFPIFVDPSFTVTHNGMKQYKGDFSAFIAGLQKSQLPSPNGSCVVVCQ